MKCFLFHLKNPFRSQDITFLSWFFGYVEKQLDLKDKTDFKICDATTWEANNCDTHIAQYFKKQKQ